MDRLGESWETIYGKFNLDNESVRWIMNNAKTSMYDTKRSYIYNKAFFEKFLNDNKEFAKKQKMYLKNTWKEYKLI